MMMKTSERLAKLEAIVANIRDNHLHSVENKIDKLDSRMWAVLIITLVGAVGTLVSMLMN
jgi:type II secretory pathway component PulF